MTSLRAPSLFDATSCGEDLAYNARRFSQLAPDHCAGCADYHIRSAVHRCAGPPKSVFDRPELIRLMRRMIDDASLRSDRMIDIIIAGSADTAVLATCAHAAVTLGAPTLARCRFTVIDSCETPLLICAEFAARHGLHFQARHGDLLSASKPCDADLIVTHSIFRFIERADQASLLKRLGSWLAPHGRLIFSNRLLLDDKGAEARDEIRKRTAANKAAQEALAKGLLQLSEPAEAILGRLERSIADGEGRPGEFRSPAEVEALVRQSGLAQISLECLTWEFAIGPGDLMRRRRVLAVLGRADG
jgi:hypothetical protein